MSNYMDDKSDEATWRRERAFLHAGRLLALYLDNTHCVTDAGPFDPNAPTPVNPSGLPLATAYGYLAAGVSYEVDLALHNEWEETDHDALGDHLAYLRNDAGHLGGACENDATGDGYLDDEDWVEETYKQVFMLKHWTAVASLAEALLEDPVLDPKTIEAMLRVVGPCCWALYLLPSGEHDDETCEACN